MARERKLSVAGINLTIHPHSSDKYISLLQDAFRLGRHFKSRGDQHLILSELKKPNSSGVVEGAIARFTDIDMNLPWFNVEKRGEAEEDEVEQINIPSELKPNYTPFYFSFFPKKHILIFESYSVKKRLSPGALKSFFEKLFQDLDLIEKYGEVNVSVVTDKEALRKILSLPTISNVKMFIKRPNPDDLAEYETKLLQELDDQNINEVIYEHRAIRGQSIELNNDRRKIAYIAADNGKVEVKGRDANGHATFQSTANYPKSITESYDTDVLSARQKFNELAYKFFQSE